MATELYDRPPAGADRRGNPIGPDRRLSFGPPTGEGVMVMPVPAVGVRGDLQPMRRCATPARSEARLVLRARHPKGSERRIWTRKDIARRDRRGRSI